MNESKPQEQQQALSFDLPKSVDESIIDDTLIFGSLPQNSVNDMVDAEWEMPKIELFEEDKTDDLLGFEVKSLDRNVPQAFINKEKENTLEEHKMSSNTNEGQLFNSNETEMNEGEVVLSERKNRLRDMSMKFQNPNSLQELENQPAYLRRNKSMEELPHSSDSNVSKYTVNSMTVNGESRPEIRKNNPFLHDTVD